MKAAQFPLTRDIVLIGGGHTHALVLKRWGMKPLEGVRLTLINPEPTAPYTGMLPGHIAGHYQRAELEIDLVQLARFAGARLILGSAERIETDRRLVHVPGRPAIAYDIASLDIGITSDLPEIPGYAEHAVSAKPMGPFARAWSSFLASAASGAIPQAAVVIGGGTAGVELALAMAHRMHNELAGTASVTVIEAGERPLPGVGAATRRALVRHMERLSVTLLTGTRVVRMKRNAVTLSNGVRLSCGIAVGAAGARPQPWLAGSELDLTGGYVTVDETLRSVSAREVFAVGDCAHMRASPRPKAGVYAVRQAPVLFDNLRAAASGRPLRRYRPQRDHLKLIATGGKGAVADKWGLPLDGRLLWRIKDRIDARFMAGFSALTPMAPPPPPEIAAEGMIDEIGNGQPLCGGCGAKMTAPALRTALAVLPAPARSELRHAPGDDAAVLELGDGRTQVIATDHLRAFTEDPWAMARIAAVHALGDIWAMGATPQVALATVILPRMSEALQARTLSEITAGAAEVFGAAGADIAGGHSSMGAEMTIGFTVTGLAGDRVLTKGGAIPGDVLLLTKPLGSGTILAAEMLLAAEGRHVAACLASMAREQGTAAEILAPEAHAMTDVTGFGLVGHLMEMLAGSTLGARLQLSDIPFLDGAVQLAAAGYRASIAPANRAAALRILMLPPALVDDPRTALLFDPQTAGGLLAALPADRAEPLMRRLRDAGYGVAVIGALEAGSGQIFLESTGA